MLLIYFLIFLLNINFRLRNLILLGMGDWGLGIGDWGLGIGKYRHILYNNNLK